MAEDLLRQSSSGHLYYHPTSVISPAKSLHLIYAPAMMWLTVTRNKWVALSRYGDKMERKPKEDWSSADLDYYIQNLEHHAWTAEGTQTSNNTLRGYSYVSNYGYAGMDGYRGWYSFNWAVGIYRNLQGISVSAISTETRYIQRSTSPAAFSDFFIYIVDGSDSALAEGSPAPTYSEIVAASFANFELPKDSTKGWRTFNLAQPHTIQDTLIIYFMPPYSRELVVSSSRPDPSYLYANEPSMRLLVPAVSGQ